MSKALFGFEPIGPDMRARELRHKLSLGTQPIENMEQICTNLGVIFMEEDLGKGNIAGCLVKEDNGSVIIINKNIPYYGRKRFTIAHELGHDYMHENRRYECSATIIESFMVDNKQEREANIFASEFLLPSEKVSELLRRREVTLTLISAVAEEYGMSLTATALRLISETKFDVCAMIIFSGDRVLWVKGSNSLNKDWAIKKSDLYLPRGSSTKGKKGLISDWLIPNNKSNAEYVWEEHLVFDRLGMAMTLISVIAEDDDEYEY